MSISLTRHVAGLEILLGKLDHVLATHCVHTTTCASMETSKPSMHILGQRYSTLRGPASTYFAVKLEDISLHSFSGETAVYQDIHAWLWA